MELKHKNKTYELVELKEPTTSETFDIIAIFETRKNGDFWELGDFINYFYGASVESTENIKSIAIDYINDYEKQQNRKKIEQLESALINAYLNVETKGLDPYENALSDLISELLKVRQTKAQVQNDQPKQPQTTKQKIYKRVLEIINKLGDENNEQDPCELVEELENLLPFKNKKEHSKWTDLTITFKCWEDWESATLEIAQRLNK